MRFLPLFLALFSSDASGATLCNPDECVLIAPRPVPLLRIDTEFSLPEMLPFVQDLVVVLKAKEPRVTISIDSPGGSVGLGMVIVNAINTARRPPERGGWNMKVDCVVPRGAVAASMAALFFEAACDTRTMAPDASLLFHEVSVSGADGTEHDLRRLADKINDLAHRLAILVAPRLRDPATGAPMTARSYEAWVKERDRWLSADEALERGAVDKVE